MLESSTSIWDTIEPKLALDQYDEPGKKQPYQRICNFPNNSSISFALSLRGPPVLHESVVTSVVGDDGHDVSEPKIQSTGCRNKLCQKTIEFLDDILSQIKKNQEKVDQLTVVLSEAYAEEQRASLEEQKAYKEESVLVVELASVSTQEREGRYAERLETLQAEKRELRQHIAKASHLYQKLLQRRNHFLPDGNARTLLNGAPPTEVSAPRQEEILPSTRSTRKRSSTKSNFYHTGLYRRSKESDWELAWTCCMKRGEHGTGCTKAEFKHNPPRQATLLPSTHAGGLQRPLTASSSGNIFPRQSYGNTGQIHLSSSSRPTLTIALRHSSSMMAASSTGRPLTVGGTRDGKLNRQRHATTCVSLLPNNSIKSNGGPAACQSNKRSERLTLPAY